MRSVSAGALPAGCLVFTCLLILPSMAGCRKKTPEGKAFRFLLDSDPRQLDPQVSTDRSFGHDGGGPV